MSTISSAAATTFNPSNTSVANRGDLTPSQDGMTRLMSMAAGSNPVEAGNALRQLDAITGGAPQTNAVLQQDGTKIAGLPFPVPVDCNSIPRDLIAVVGSVDGSLVPESGGFFASAGKFTAPDLANGRIYHGFYGTAGMAAGVSVGVGVSGGAIRVGDIAGRSVVGSVSTPWAGGTATFSTDGRLTGISGGPGARAGAYGGGAETTMGGCFYTPAPTIR
jgi:hypothetical protein